VLTETAVDLLSTRLGNPARRFLPVALFVSFLLAPTLMAAQVGGRQGARFQSPREVERSQGEKEGPRNPLQGGIFRRLRDLPPAEQRRFMANNPEFQRLSPERQELIRERLRQWNSMPPRMKERVREREEILEGLSPAQRQEARNIFPQWRELTPERRQAVMEAFRHLRDLSPKQRQPYLDSQQVREQFSPHERDILSGLDKLLPATPPKAVPDPDE